MEESKGEERGREGGEGRKGEERGGEREKKGKGFVVVVLDVCMYSTTNLPTEEQLQNSLEICQHLM